MPDRKSTLLPLGVLLVLVGLGVPSLMIRAGQSGIVVDLIRVCFFAGVTFIILSLYRKRKSKPPSKD